MDYTIGVGVEKKMTLGDKMPYYEDSGRDRIAYFYAYFDAEMNNCLKYTIKKVVYNYPATIVFWADGSKTVVKSMLPDYESTEEQGLLWAIAKKVVGSTAHLNKIIDNMEIQNYEDH